LWIRSPNGHVWRNLRYPADRDFQLHPESFLLLDDGSVLGFVRAVLALHRSDNNSDSGVKYDVESALICT